MRSPYYFKVNILDIIFKKTNGNIESNCNQITFENEGNGVVRINDKVLVPGESMSYPQGNPHPLEFITTQFGIKYLNGKNFALRVSRKYVEQIDKPLPLISTEQ